MRKRTISLLAVVGLLLFAFGSTSASARSAAVSRAPKADKAAYTVTNLVSDVPGAALAVDPNLVNAWGLTSSATSPWWVADNGTDVSTLYDGAGVARSLVVQVEGAPTGTVFNGGTGFVVSDGTNSGAAAFIFDTEAGTIRGWNPNVPPPPPSTHSFVLADRSNVGAIYKGLAIASTAAGDFLYAADFHNARVDMFDGSMTLVSTSSTFVDPGLPAGFAPFGIQNIGGRIFVSYAKQDADAEDEVAGKGLGVVDVFDTAACVPRPGGLGRGPERALGPRDGARRLRPVQRRSAGRQLRRRRHQCVRAEAERRVGHAEGTCASANGQRILIDGLWALEFGNGGAAGPTTTLFFTAGPDEEAHGLFGKIELAS